MESDPIEEPPEAIIPMEIVSSSSRSATTTTTATRSGLVRKVARRTESWYPPPPRRGTRQRQLPTYFASLPPPQAEDIPARARKKRRLEEPLPTTTDEAARKTASPDDSLGPPPPPAADGDIEDANTDADFVTDTQPTGSWTIEEDAKLTRAIANTSKMKWGKEYKTNWITISELIPGRTNIQCYNRWHNFLDPSIDRANGRTGKWTAVEDSKLKDAVQTHVGENWETIAVLVPGRTKIQCRTRWCAILDTDIDPRTARAGR
jgi:hypothetical protein